MSDPKSGVWKRYSFGPQGEYTGEPPPPIRGSRATRCFSSPLAVSTGKGIASPLLQPLEKGGEGIFSPSRQGKANCCHLAPASREGAEALVSIMLVFQAFRTQRSPT